MVFELCVCYVHRYQHCAPMLIMPKIMHQGLPDALGRENYVISEVSSHSGVVMYTNGVLGQ